MSIAIVPLIGLALNYAPWDIRLYPILIPITLLILVASGIAWYRRRKLAPAQRFGVALNIKLPK